jgi:hypothetical protein
MKFIKPLTIKVNFFQKKEFKQFALVLSSLNYLERICIP